MISYILFKIKRKNLILNSRQNHSCYQNLVIVQAVMKFKLDKYLTKLNMNKKDEQS